MIGAAGGHRLRVGESLRRQSLTSRNDAFTLNHFGCEDLMLIRNRDREPLWWPSASHPGDWRPRRFSHDVSDVTLQPDGDLVAHDENGTPLWSTGTAGHGVELLEVRDDGDVVLLDGAGEMVWHAGTGSAEAEPSPFAVARGDRLLVGQSLADQSLTSPNGQYVLVHGRRYGGTFLYGPNGLVTTWFYLLPAHHPQQSGPRLVLAEDGLFLLFPDGVRQAWDSPITARFPFHPRQVVVRDSGDLEMLDVNGEVMWRNGYTRGSAEFDGFSNQARSRTGGMPVGSPTTGSAATSAAHAPARVTGNRNWMAGTARPTAQYRNSRISL